VQSWKSAAFLPLLLSLPLTAQAGPLPYDNPLGITVNMDEAGGPAADPAGRLTAAIPRLEGSLGKALPGDPPKTDTSSGKAISVVARQFHNDPGQLHMLVASETGGGICHIRAPISTAVKTHIPAILVLCMSHFGKSASAPAAAQIPTSTQAAPTKAAAALGARYPQNWAQVEGVYFRSTPNFGVGGMMIMEFEPVILFKDGSYYEIRDQALEDTDLAAARQAHPKAWGKWTGGGASFTLTGSSGKPYHMDLQQGQFYKAFPASAGKLSSKYERMSGGGNSAVGGDVMIAVQNQIAFSPDGRFAQGADVGALNSGNMTGVASTVAARNGKTGTYTIKDYTLTLTYADGKVERQFFAFGSQKTPARVDTGMIFIGDRVYTDSD
jgi:hypothetical protein